MFRLPGTWVSLPVQKKFLIYPVAAKAQPKSKTWASIKTTLRCSR